MIQTIYHFNTDGVAIVRSSGASVWPVYLTINKLPPLERLMYMACLAYIKSSTLLLD